MGGKAYTVRSNIFGRLEKSTLKQSSFLANNKHLKGEKSFISHLNPVT